MDESVAAALKACDNVSIVLEAELAAIDSCATLLRQLQAVLCLKPPVIQLVAVDRMHQSQRIVATHMARHLKLAPVVTVTPAADDLSAAYLAGVPLLSTLHPDEAFARSLQALSDVLVSSESQGRIAP
jgi:cellulose biosynthesis protein BcsQ